MSRLGRAQPFKPKIIGLSRLLLGFGIVFDTASNSGYIAASANPTWTHVNNGNFLAVDVHILSVPGTTASAVTYNGVSMTRIGAQSTVSGAGRVECWGLVAPAMGSNTISVTLTASVVSAGTSVSYGGVHQTSPYEAFNSAQATNVGAADATVNVTSVASNCWIHGACSTDDTAITANQRSRNNVTGAMGSGANEDIGPIAPGATAVSYTDVAALATWAMAGYAIRPVAAAGLGAFIKMIAARFGLAGGKGLVG